MKPSPILAAVAAVLAGAARPPTPQARLPDASPSFRTPGVMKRMKRPRRALPAL